MSRVRINAPSRYGTAIGNFWKLRTQAGQAGNQEAKWCTGHPVAPGPESRALLTTVNAPIVAHAINELALQKEAEI